jgi:ribosomal protein S18 acetylase RimI-like enzyme
LAQSFIVRKYREGDEKGIVELMLLCFGRTDYDYLIKHWFWEYEENPLGKIAWVVEHKGQIVAHIGLVRVNVKVDEKILRSIIAADAMTHPKFRRRRLQRKMFVPSDKELVKANIHFSYWFPGEIMLKHGRQGIDYTCKIPALVKFLDTYETIRELVGSRFLAKVLSVFLNPTIRVFFRSKRKPVIEDVKIKEVKQFDDRINVFWETVSKFFRIIVVRDKKYLNWRYFRRPDSDFKVFLAETNGKVQGYIVFSSKGGEGYIVDLLVHPHRLNVAQKLVSTAVRHFRQEKVHRIICLMLKNNPYYRMLRTNGFIHISSKFGFGVSIYSPSKVPAGFLKNPDNWYLTLGDTDGISEI